MNTDPSLQNLSRRHFFSRCSMGLGSIALASLLGRRAGALELPNPMACKPALQTPKAKNIIYLFMAGGPSQLELFDFKPKLVELNGHQQQVEADFRYALLLALCALFLGVIGYYANRFRLIEK